MDSTTKELLIRLENKLDSLETDVKDLLAWKNRMMGVFIAVSVLTTFLINELKSRLGIV